MSGANVPPELSRVRSIAGARGADVRWERDVIRLRDFAPRDRRLIRDVVRLVEAKAERGAAGR